MTKGANDPVKTVLLAAVSLDGFITRHDEPGSSFTSPEDKEYFHRAVLDFDSLVFGSVNYALSRSWISRHLRPDQLKLVMTRKPESFSNESIPGEIEFHRGSARSALQHLAEAGKRRCALLGGGITYNLFLKEGCVDEIWLTVEPRVFGHGVPLAPGKLDARLELMDHRLLAPSTLLLRYRVVA